MALFGNYNTPGRGVLKTPHEKRPFFKFWEVYFRHAWQLMGLNLLYFIFLIPLFATLLLASENLKWLALSVTAGIMGPATAAMTRVARNYSQERHTFLWHDFFHSFKLNFKQGLIMGYIDTVAIISFVIGVPIYQQMALQNSTMYIPYVICLACMLVFFMMHFYIYQMICSTNLSMKQILRNALFLVSIGMKKTIFTLLTSLFIIIFNYLMLLVNPGIGIALVIFFPFTFLTFVACFNCYPVIRKHVIQPYYDQLGEENPENAGLTPAEGEALFEDKAAEETAPPAASKSSKRKTIR
ncbi:DUF624 domain-containing protein [Ruminococcus sp.]|uniref:YesL family protein n=1 Tax=Ruminococcus sp. TaxID=41978 RepID=UPI0025F92C0E|nr:DUF624 domain-containing protein [Ruminococcus sp.]MBQ8966664.1 DUF624 domain-containing protein [Ruminococcus sp.]